jgi:hypothetical protein
MVSSLVHHRVADYDAWKRVYDGVEGVQREGGVRSHRVWRVHDDPSVVVVEHSFDDVASAQQFFDNPELRQAMADAGVDMSSFQIEFLDETAGGTF